MLGQPFGIDYAQPLREAFVPLREVLVPLREAIVPPGGGSCASKRDNCAS